MTRPDWDMYFLGIAEAVAARGDCTRRQVGAVIADQNHRVISTGYNGSYPGGPSCLAGQCPRGRHYKTRVLVYPSDGGQRIPGAHPSPADMCACGLAWPCPDAVPSGSSYDTGPGACIAQHAELNAVLYAFRSIEGMTMYITTEPCDGCLKILRGSRLAGVVTPSGRITWGLSLGS